MVMTHSYDPLVEAIRADILAGQFHPRERLVEVDLAERYEAPRAAVRSALITLSAEGLVDRQPHRGARVRSFTVEEAIEVAETRRELEALVARHAAGAATEQERAEIARLVDEMRACLHDRDFPGYRRLSRRFHHRLAEIARHATAQRFLAEMRNHKLDRHFPEAFPAKETGSSLPEHQEIAAAVTAGDPEQAADAMYRHVSSVVARLREYQSHHGAADQRT